MAAAKKPVRRARNPLFTVGYEGRELPELLAVLASAGVECVIDIRELPLSRRRGFSKTPLREALERAGIEYVHLRVAGNPYRKERHDLPREVLLAKYDAHVDATPEVVATVVDSARGRRAALLCYEAAPEECHRSRLAPRVAAALHCVVRDL
jgi:uncharacterized protein (DUF488 family)